MLESGDADDSDRVKAARGELAALKASYAQLRREFRRPMPCSRRICSLLTRG
jgi:hypothetical protein